MRRTAIKRRRSGKPWKRVMDDGREVLNLRSVKGRAEYRRRVLEMRARQGYICCLHGIAPCCTGSLYEAEPTFEHESGRGMGGAHRDDRITLPDGTWINGAAHAACNAWKGSRCINYNEGTPEVWRGEVQRTISKHDCNF